MHLLSACCQQHALVLGQQAVSDATGELGAIRSFLASPPLAGARVPFDVEFTQWLVAKQVVDRGGAYLMVVNASQPSLFRACVESTAEYPKRPRRPLGQAHTHQLAHGRLEQRSLLAVAAPPDLGFRMRTRCCVCNDGFVRKRTGEVVTDETAVTSLTAEHATQRPVTSAVAAPLVDGKPVTLATPRGLA